MEWKINEVAQLSGVTVRTLHYYDQIGLLKPGKVTEAGYRLYNRENLALLQQILFYRELDFSLDKIKQILQIPGYDRQYAMRQQKELLLKKRKKIDDLIRLLDRELEGEGTMSFREFDMTEIENAKKQYAEEIERRWGHTAAYAECEEKTKSYSKKQWKTLGEEGEKILRAFGELRTENPEGEEAQKLVRQWQEYMTANFYQCTDEILAGLGMMYTADERFRKNLDKNGEGTAEFMAKAIACYCKMV